MYHSKYRQDEILNTLFFNNKTNGVFVDIGAFDGVHDSDTFFYENVLGWTGLCLEIIPSTFERLKDNRTCICVNMYPISRYPNSIYLYDIARNEPTPMQKIKCDSITNILITYGITNVDFMKIKLDKNRFTAITGLDLNKISVGVLSIEMPHKLDDLSLAIIKAISRTMKLHSRIGNDVIFIHPSMHKK